MKKTMLSACILALSAICLNAQTSVARYNPQKDNRDGLVYYLPQTKLNIAITATCTVQKVGPFYQYAQRFLATKDVILQETNSWNVDSIEIQAVPVADPSREYLVKFDKKGISNNICFYSDHIISSVNAEPLDIMPEAPLNMANDRPIELKFDYTALSEETLTSTSIPKMAEMAARQIYRIREARMDILTANLDQMPDGKAIKKMLARLDKIEYELTALFVGKSATYSVTKVYDIIPNSDLDNQIIARISTAEGLIDSQNVIGAPIYMKVEGKHVSDPAPVRRRDRSVKGFYYNVPGSAVVTVYFNSYSVAKTVDMPQFGYATYLNPKLTEGSSAKIVFNPQTGTINTFSK